MSHGHLANRVLQILYLMCVYVGRNTYIQNIAPIISMLLFLLLTRHAGCT